MSARPLWIALIASLASLLLGPLPVRADDLRFQRFYIEQGLSDGHVKAMLQDQRGFLWLGTRNGLNRYDGHRFQSYYARPGDANTLPSSDINALVQTQSGDLWVGTADNGLARFDDRSQQFERINLAGAAGSRRIHDLLLDGGVLASTDDGLWQQQADGSFLQVAGTAGLAMLASVRAGDTRWSITAEGLWWQGRDGHVRPAVDRFPALEELRARRLQTLFVDGDQQLLIGTDNGLFSLRTDSGVLEEKLAIWLPDLTGSGRQVLSLLRDRNGQLWIGTRNGVIVRSNDGQRIRHYTPDPADPHSLADERPFALLEDRDGLIWLGGLNGMSLHNPATRQFELLRQHSGDNALQNNSVMSVLEDSAGQLWVGTFGAMLHRFSVDRSALTIVPVQAEQGSQRDDLVLSLLEHPRGTIWAGQRTRGLTRIDQKTAAARPAPQAAAAAVDLHAGTVYDMTPAGDDALWLATRAGLVRYQISSGQTELFAPPSESGGSADTCLYTVTPGLKGELWLGGCIRAGLLRFDPETRQFQRWQFHPDDPYSLSSDSVTAILVEQSGRLLLTTEGGGLNIFDPASQRFKSFRMQDGLPVDTLWGIQRQRDGIYWLSSNRGLIRFDEVSNQFLTYTPADGIQGDEFNLGAWTTGADGRFYFGGVSGLTVFNPNQLTPLGPLPSPVFTLLRLRNEPVPFAARAERAPVTGPELKLGYDDTLFSVEFSALSFAHPRTLEYSYRLKGLDDRWITTNADARQASFSSLHEGKYILEVRARDGRFGDWSAPAQLHIEVAPPWWRSAYAYVGYLLLAGVFLLMLLRWRRQRWEMQHARLAAEQARQAKSDFLATMTHELRTPLNGVLGSLQLLQRTSLSGEQQEHAFTVQASASELLQHIDDLLDYARLEARRVELKIEVVDLPELVQEVVAAQRPRASEKGLALELTLASDLPRYWRADGQRLRQILTQLLGNAIKFTVRGGVLVAVEGKDGALQLIVRDTGIGMDKATQAHLFQHFSQGESGWNRRFAGKGLGLALCRELIELMNGSITANSILGTGSEFVAQLPLAVVTSVENDRDKSTTSATSNAAGSGAAGAIAGTPLTATAASIVTSTATATSAVPASSAATHSVAVARAATVSAASVNMHGAKVLLVEDNAINRQVAQRMLEKLGCQVDTVDDGLAALAAVSADGQYLCIFMDCQMPVMDGFEATRQLRARGIHTPVVAVTANIMAGDRERCLAAGMTDYLAKPISLDAFATVLSAFVAATNVMATTRD
ncbi:response regulator [Permianibacter sp. IMCC34836]|uniref:hybrid sensor histidine kinase/response regulator n=1 Tax=Permianibacter fluminis TaxID=2738515 RepID=UPI0015572977|nr:two-component regulator propeller domain-containing protein [Permianibacter fluminis]NQD39104.1 response regulator [Permianibacter fluminis]